jgi:ketosteroid isomerase-like protein
MANQRDVIARTYTDYFEAFQTLDPEAVLPYYHTPFLALTPAGVRAVDDVADARAMFADMMKALRERGYARSGWARLGLRQLSADTAMVSCEVTRYRADGTALERFGATYAFRKTEAGWRIAMLTIHDADAVLDLPRWEPPT